MNNILQICNFSADNVNDVIIQVLNFKAIPIKIKNIVKDIKENYKNTMINHNDCIEYYWGNGSDYGFSVIKRPYDWNFFIESASSMNLKISVIGRLDTCDLPPIPKLTGSVDKRIKDFELYVTNPNIERGATFDKNGNLLSYSSGTESYVIHPFSDNIVYLTHVHPAECKTKFGSPFSDEDYDTFFAIKNCLQMRVVFPNGVTMICEKIKPIVNNIDIKRIKQLLYKSHEYFSDKDIFNTFPDIFSKTKKSEYYNLVSDSPNMTRKYIKKKFDDDKKILDNLGMKIYFTLRNNDKTEHLRAKKVTIKKKSTAKIGDNFSKLIYG